jgi:hypothetical protein
VIDGTGNGVDQVPDQHRQRDRDQQLTALDE